MSSPVILHAGQPTQLHLVADLVLGVALGLTIVVLYYLFLRYYVSPDGWEQSSR